MTFGSKMFLVLYGKVYFRVSARVNILNVFVKTRSVFFYRNISIYITRVSQNSETIDKSIGFAGTSLELKSLSVRQLDI